MGYVHRGVWEVGVVFYLLFSQTKEEGIRGFWATHLVLKDIFHLGYLQEFDARELKLFSFFYFLACEPELSLHRAITHIHEIDSLWLRRDY